MKVIILAAGQGTRLRPLTDNKPKCMVEINSKSIIQRQLETMKLCGIEENDIYILCGYRDDILREYLKDTKINFIKNSEFESTNMVYSLICAKSLLEEESNIIVSYGDIVYTPEVLKKLINSDSDLSVIVDNGWYTYWNERCENPLDDAETLIMDESKNLTEIGQKTSDINKVQSQYIGLMRYKNQGVKDVLNICEKAKDLSADGKSLWRTDRNYNKMYMTDMLQGLIDEGSKVKAIEINRGWFEVDCIGDLRIAEVELKE